MTIAIGGRLGYTTIGPVAATADVVSCLEITIILAIILDTASDISGRLLDCVESAALDCCHCVQCTNISSQSSIGSNHNMAAIVASIGGDITDPVFCRRRIPKYSKTSLDEKTSYAREDEKSNCTRPDKRYHTATSIYNLPKPTQRVCI